MEKRHNYVRKVAETAVQLFISGDKVNVAGLVLAGSADFKTELSQSDMFDQVSGLLWVMLEVVMWCCYSSSGVRCASRNSNLDVISDCPLFTLKAFWGPSDVCLQVNKTNLWCDSCQLFILEVLRSSSVVVQLSNAFCLLFFSCLAVAIQSAQISWHFLWRRKWIQSSNRIVNWGPLQCEVHSREKTNRYVTTYLVFSWAKCTSLNALILF